MSLLLPDVGKIEDDIFFTTFNRLEITLQVLVKLPLLFTSVVVVELFPSEYVGFDFVDFRGSFARICLSIVGIVEFAANNKPESEKLESSLITMILCNHEKFQGHKHPLLINI